MAQRMPRKDTKMTQRMPWKDD